MLGADRAVSGNVKEVRVGPRDAASSNAGPGRCWEKYYSSGVKSRALLT
jgi:hypothetical protein